MSDEKETSVPAIVPVSEKNLRTVTDWVSEDTTLPPEDEQVVEGMLDGQRHKSRLSAYMVATDRRDVKRIEQLQGFLDQVETRMLNPERLDNAAMKDLVALYRALGARKDKVREQLDARVNGPGVRINVNDNRSISFDIPDMNAARSREKVRTFFGGLLKRAAELEDGGESGGDGGQSSGNQS